MEKVRAAIEAANTNVNKLVKAGKYEEAGQYFAPDAIQMIAGQPPIHGREAWIAVQRENAQIGVWDLNLEIVDLEVNGEMAVERGRGTQTFTANEHSPIPSFSMTGDYLVLWKKVDGHWQIQWDYVVTHPPEE